MGKCCQQCQGYRKEYQSNGERVAIIVTWSSASQVTSKCSGVMHLTKPGPTGIYLMNFSITLGLSYDHFKDALLLLHDRYQYWSVHTYAWLVFKYCKYHPYHHEVSFQLRHHLEKALPLRGLQWSFSPPNMMEKKAQALVFDEQYRWVENMCHSQGNKYIGS